MADEVYVLNEGISVSITSDGTVSTPSTPSSGTHGISTSTNPTVVTPTPSFLTENNFSFYEIYDGDVSSFGGTTTAELTANNEQETSGYRVQLDTGSASGLTINTNFHYYVLVYSDSIFKHHFAKFTEQTQYEGNIYNIDFTPRIKENIPLGTQVKIFKGPATSSSIAAIGYGLINDPDPSSGPNNTDERHDKYVNVSRPTFFFHTENDRLGANRKYSLIKRIIGSSSATSLSVFKTAPLTSDYILDKSFFTLNATIVDNNKILDNASTPQLRNTSSGTGATYTFDRTDFNDSSRNIYYSDSGHTTYIGFIDSPHNNQSIPNSINTKTTKTVTNRGNAFESRFSDINKFMDKKIKQNERVEVKDTIKQQGISYFPNATLYGVYNNHSDSNKIQVSGLEEGQDLNTLLFNSSSSKYELILIGSYYYLPSAISSPSGGGQIITVANRRAISSALFEGSTTVVSMTDATAFRKEWSPVVNNFITTHPIDTVIESGTLKRNNITLSENSEADVNGLEYNIGGTNFGFVIDVSRGDNVNGYVEFQNSPSSSYYATTDLFSSLKGRLAVDKIIFQGRIENIEKKIERGAHIIIASGRDDIGKLLSTTVDKNYKYLTDYVYSTITPLAGNISGSFVDTNLQFDTTSTSSTDTNKSSDYQLKVTGISNVDLEYGDVIYLKIGTRYVPVGVVAGLNPAGSLTSIDMLSDLFLDLHTDYHGSGLGSFTADVYVGKNFLIAGKSSDISLKNTSATSLYGSLDKGYRLLGSGKSLTSAGVESTTNFSTLNGDGIDLNNLLITQGSSSSRKDSPIGFENENNFMSSISSMELLANSINEETGLVDVELGFVSPLVLGRIDVNDNVAGETFYDDALGLYLVNSNGLTRGGFLNLVNSVNNLASGSTLRHCPAPYKEIMVDDRVGSGTVSVNYSMRFGSPIFRLNYLSPSVLKRHNTFKTYSLAKGFVGKLYYDNPSAFRFYGSVFRLMGTGVVDKDYYEGKSESTLATNLRELPVEQKGYLPALGSTGHDIIYYPLDFDNKLEHIGPRLWPEGTGFSNQSKNFLEQYDPIINHTFLFTAGDIMPDSKKRPDNPFNETISRDLTNYFLMVKYKSPTSNDFIGHTSYNGATNLLGSRESDYQFFPIETASGTSPKRMNLLRLRTMTVDSLFNEVDFESYKTRTTIFKTVEAPSPVINSIPNGGLSVYPCHTTSATSSSSKTIAVDNSAGLWLYSGTSGIYYNRYIFTNPADDSTGKSRFLGTIDTKTTTALTLVSNCLIDGYSGEIYITEQDIRVPFDGSTENIGTPLTSNVALTGEDYIYPTANGSAGKHNPNIQSIDTSNITLNNKTVYTDALYVENSSLPTAAQNFRGSSGATGYTSSVGVSFSAVDNSTHSPLSQITLNIETLSTGSVAPDLTHYRVGQRIEITDHTTSAYNIRYTIESATATSLTIRSVPSATLSNDATIRTATIRNIDSERYFTMAAGGSRLLTDRESIASIAQHDDIYVGMGVVVAKNGGSSTTSQATSDRIFPMKLKDITSHNNYGTTITTSDNTVLTTSDRYFGDTTSISGSSAKDTGLESDVAELLFTPIIDLAKSNVSKEANLDSTGRYDTYGYIYIDFDYDWIRNLSGPLNGSNQHWIHYIGSLAGKYLINTRTNKLHYVVNHQLSKNGASGVIRHYISIDNYADGEINNDDKFEVLTVCTRTTLSSKTNYPLYEYNSTNVINPETGRFYEKTEMERDWLATSLDVDELTFLSNTPMVKGMFVVADIDGAGSSHLVHRTGDTPPFTIAEGYTVCLSDGQTAKKHSMDVLSESVSSSTAVKVLSFNDIENYNGSVSIGEIVNVSIIGKIDREVEYAKIVLPFEVLTEAEDIADDILSSIGIDYVKSSDTSKYYIGSNFDGQDAFTAANSVLDYKGLKIIIDGESIKVTSDEDDKDYRNILFDEEVNDFNITSFKRDVSIYDKFNSIVIIGDNVRGIAKNHTEIQKDGVERKKEIYDFSITSQVQADELAQKTLGAFSTLSNAIELEVGSDIPHINPGQIIELKFEREGVFRGNFVVIEVHRQSGLPTKLLLGEYNKDLAATISLLLGETRNLQGRNKRVYKTFTSPNIVLQNTRIKFVQAKITSRTAVSGSTTILGFGKTIGFTSEMGP
tara:strand:- start:927 stop:7328 length:6402 start_codon:yes stop_codon:yes gene_type:complete